jgi:eukaryotic-like serine/threonine-protein kinase
MGVTSGKTCTECGLPIPASDLGNRCPNCLLEFAITPPPDPSTEAATPRPRSIPRFFGNYEILDEIGRGGMGVIYRARQLNLNRTVALKFIQPGLLASSDALMRFQVEVHTASQLNHPNIVSLYETGEIGGQHYFSMSLVDGGSLAEWSGRCEARDSDWIRRAVALLLKVAGAVHHAHQHAILHRDLKPSNILMDANGEPHITDFGLAKVLGSDCGLTRTESIVGSPNYMAPEQASGHSHEVTTAADIYSLGAILYHLLTGRPPFLAPTALETMRLVVEQPPVSPRKINPRVDANLETICLKCLRKDPQARYSSADELAQDLHAWLNDLPIRARRVTTLGALWLWSRRRPAVAALGAALLLALIAIAIGSSVAVVRVSRAERKTTAVLRDALLHQARTLRLTLPMGNRAAALDRIRQAAALGGDLEFRNQLREELLATLARADVIFIPQAHLPASPDSALNQIGPGFDRWAVATNNIVILISLPGGSEITRFAVADSPVEKLEAFSPNGRFLALRQAEAFSVWDTQTGRACFSTNNPAIIFCFTPNSQLAIQVDRKVVSIRSLPSSDEVKRLDPYADDLDAPRVSWSSLAFSPDGRTLAAQRRISRVTELIDVATGKLSRSLTNTYVGGGVCWNRRGTHLAVATARNQVVVWNLRSGVRVFESSSFTGRAEAMALNASGSLLAASFEDRRVRLFDLDANRVAAEIDGFSHSLSFDRSGARLGPVFVDGAAGFVQLQESTHFSEVTLGDTSLEFREFHLSGDGRIAAVGTQTNVILCDTLTGRQLLNQQWGIRTTCFDPNQAAVLSSGSPGLFRWDMEWRGSNRIVLAREERLTPERGWRWFDFARDGNLFAGANLTSGMVVLFDRTFTNRLAELGPHDKVDFTALSPDGRWVASGSSTDGHVRVWDRQSGREAFSIEMGVLPRAVFSRDGKWFASFGKTFDLREVGSWKAVALPPTSERQPIFKAAAFSPNSRLLAAISGHSTVQLFDLATWQPAGLLRPPGYVRMHAVLFSPDGKRLLAVGNVGRMRAWDLTRLRAELNDFGFEWPVATIPTE